MFYEVLTNMKPILVYYNFFHQIADQQINLYLHTIHQNNKNIVDFAVQADHWVKLKESEEKG